MAARWVVCAGLVVGCFRCFAWTKSGVGVQGVVGMVGIWGWKGLMWAGSVGV
jgi:hypothetical protein